MDARMSSARWLIAWALVGLGGILAGRFLGAVFYSMETDDTLGALWTLIALLTVVPLWPLRWWVLLAVPAAMVAHLVLAVFLVVPLARMVG